MRQAAWGIHKIFKRALPQSILFGICDGVKMDLSALIFVLGDGEPGLFHRLA